VFSDSQIKLFVVLMYVVGLSLALVWLSQGGAFAAAITSLTLTASLVIFLVQQQERR
jgi:hypothetical protein